MTDRMIWLRANGRFKRYYAYHQAPALSFLREHYYCLVTSNHWTEKHGNIAPFGPIAHPTVFDKAKPMHALVPSNRRWRETVVGTNEYTECPNTGREHCYE